MIHRIPERLHITIVKIGCGHQHVAQTRGFKGSDIGLLPGHQKTTQYLKIRLDRGTIDSREISLVDFLHRLERQRGNLMPEDPDPDVMKLKVGEVGNIVFYSGMAFAK